MYEIELKNILFCWWLGSVLIYTKPEYNVLIMNNRYSRTKMIKSLNL